MVLLRRPWAFLGLFITARAALEVDFTNPASVKQAASTVAYNMMTYYKGNVSGQIPGLLPGPYYWWEAGGMFGCLIDYWHYTGDDTYNAVTYQAMQFQVGEHNDYMPSNQSFDMGNDDQAFWAMAAMTAAETNFQNPPANAPSWLSLAQAVFNEQISRWDTTTCGGGIRWQVVPTNGGYDLKNTISNGCLFNIAARLARFTNDDFYAQWAYKIWDWLSVIGLIDENYNVYDNSEAVTLNCTQVDKLQWTYNAGTLLMGASTLYNYTNGDPLWKNRTSGLLSTLAFDFFPDGVMKDICEETNKCNTDEQSFKAYLGRWMAATTQMAPFTFDTIIALLTSTAKAAAAQCTGGPDGNACGLKWYLNGTWDGTLGVGQQMGVMEALLGTLISQTQAPLTNTTGGTSVSNPSAGYNESSIPPGEIIIPATKSEKAGAWVLTTLILILAVGTTWFMWSTAWESRIDNEVAGGAMSNWKGKAAAVEKRRSGGVLPHIGEEEIERPYPKYLGGTTET